MIYNQTVQLVNFFTYIYYFMHVSKDWYDRESEKILTFGVHLNKAAIISSIFYKKKLERFTLSVPA
jgi:hypothetical protein